MKQTKWKQLPLTLLSFALSIGMAACSGAPSEKDAASQPAAASGASGASAAAGAAEPKADLQIDKNNKNPMTVTLAGGSVGGFWSGMGQVISKSFSTSYPGSAATYEPGSGAGNIKLIDEGQVELGIVQAIEVTAAKNGIAPFNKKYENLMALATIYDNAVLQVTVRKDFADKYGLTGLADISAKKAPARIAINQKGNMNSLGANTLLEVNGITEATLKQWGGSLTWTGSAQRFEAMQNNRMDISIDFVFAPDSKVEETAVNTELVQWSLDQKSKDALKKVWELNDIVVPKGTYKWQKEDVNTVTLSAVILVSKKASVQDQYKMAKALVDNVAILRELHPAMKEISAQKLADTGSVPLAPGAKALFEDVGALKK
ncbi:TAXI family TRAP transporter solute-binding subunit [Paenibacillus validus]|nr:TAXI family TRAP transporter solute-binding subunit [Paenibacillus validus]